MHSAQVVAVPGRTENAEPEWSVLCDGATVEGSGGRPIIKDISCRVSPHGITAIMGANGAGKSMLLKVIAGLSQLTAGHVQIHAQFAGKCALVFQKPVLLRRSVRANLAHALRIARVAPAERRAKMQVLFDIAGLSGLESRPARSLSGGEQQRLQISRALAADPKLLLLDEPTGSLDPHATATIEALLRTTAAAGVKIVLVTHDVGQARRLADDVLFLHRGMLTERGRASEMLERPKSKAAAAYLEGKLEF